MLVFHCKEFLLTTDDPTESKTALILTCGNMLKYNKPRPPARMPVIATKLKCHKKRPRLQMMIQVSSRWLFPQWSRNKMDAAINPMIRTAAHSSEIVCSGVIIKRIQAGS